MLRRRTTIPSPDTRALRRPWLRTGIVRAVLVLAACGLLAAAFVSARGLEPRSNELVPGGKSGVVVLDVSLSIANEDFVQARNVLERLIESDNPTGLVVFSDTAYELLPPRTPAKELRPVLRFFTPVGDRLPPNPWVSIQGGTAISRGLELAHEMIERDGVSPGSIVLISDLETAATDFTPLGQALARIKSAGITMRVVQLAFSTTGRTFFGGILGEEAFVDPVEPTAADPRPIDISLRGETPLLLLLLSGLVLFVLAAHERFAGRLALPAGARWRVR